MEEPQLAEPERSRSSRASNSLSGSETAQALEDLVERLYEQERGSSTPASPTDASKPASERLGASFVCDSIDAAVGYGSEEESSDATTTS